MVFASNLTAASLHPPVFDTAQEGMEAAWVPEDEDWVHVGIVGSKYYHNIMPSLHVYWPEGYFPYIPFNASHLKRGNELHMHATMGVWENIAVGDHIMYVCFEDMEGVEQHRYINLRTGQILYIKPTGFGSGGYTYIRLIPLGYIPITWESS